MNITDVRVRPVNKEDKKMKAVASITIDGEFVVHDIKVIESERGLFIAMPSKKDGNDEYKDVAHPLDTATRKRIQDAVIAKYEEVIGDTE
jgi:stage V sporulation protein G